MGDGTGTGGTRKTILVVESDKEILELTTENLELRGCSVTPMLYRPDVDVPRATRFDLAIVSGLKGDYFRVLESVDAERKILLSGNPSYVERAKQMGIEAYMKPKSVEDFLKD